VDYRRNMSIIGLARSRGYKQIVAVASYAEMEEDRAEVAFVVREDFQNAGVGSRLLEVLEGIAKENGYKGFLARVLRENSSMLQVFKKKYPRLNGVLEGGEIEITMDFDSRSITSPVPEGMPEETTQGAR
jgi:GNAT superfamily N-acetyltransferase